MRKIECAIIMAYTGAVMLTGEDIIIFYKYIENIMKRPVYTHELADEAIVKEIKARSKIDFIKLCATATYH